MVSFSLIVKIDGKGRAFACRMPELPRTGEFFCKDGLRYLVTAVQYEMALIGTTHEARETKVIAEPV